MMMLGIMMAAFVACNKEEEPVDPNKVIESELVDQGQTEEVTEVDNGTSGISLSYESWIVVYQVFADGSTSPNTRSMTKSSADGTKISVVLKNDITNAAQTIDVPNFDVDDEIPKMEYKELSSAPHATRTFVTVIDSASVYTINNGLFVTEFILPYQVAVYDDGITKVTMPYHKYTNIQDKGSVWEDMDNVTEGEKTYQVKKYVHTIVAAFNGKEYTVTVTITLRKLLTGDYILSKKVVNEGMELVSYDLDAKTGISRSWIEIEESWSESGTKKVTEEVLLYNGLPEEEYRIPTLTVNHEIPYSSLTTGNAESTESVYGNRSEEKFAIDKYLQDFSVSITSTADPSVSDAYLCGVTYEKAVYTDEYIRYNMPYLSFTNCIISLELAKDWYNYDSYRTMDFNISVNLSYGSLIYNFLSSGNVRRYLYTDH
jgi:hypothetical protein